MTLPRNLSLLLTLLLALLLAPLAVAAQEVPELQITSTHYIVIDAESGEVYAQRGANDQVAIASLTKVFTAVQALSMAPLDTTITTDESDLKSSEATTMGFGPGETYTLKDMIYGMMLPSGNDAAHAIARTLGGQTGDSPDEAVQRFVDLMNKRAQDMGLKNTHLVNPDGWGVPGHHSSAWDVAAFMSYAMEYPFLVDVMGTREYTTSNGLITVTNTNKMMNSYAPLLAGKTGYDNDAGWCLVNVARADGSTMIAVTLDGVAPDDWYDDNMVLLDYGFERKAEIAASNTAFNGDVVSYTNPAAAELARAGQPAAELQGEAAQAEANQPEANATLPELVPTVSKPSIQDISPGEGRWLAIIAAIALVGIRGGLRWRDGAPATARRRPVDTVAVDS
ncbi:MAG TPA: serine hydrolase [Thermomicrobiales bacterium]|nr:serine hydrolase [Thermomicrobiales bacterium]